MFGVLEIWDNFKIGFVDKVNVVIGGINVVLDFFSIFKILEWKLNIFNFIKNKYGCFFSIGFCGVLYSG